MASGFHTAVSTYSSLQITLYCIAPQPKSAVHIVHTNPNCGGWAHCGGLGTLWLAEVA